MNAQGPSESYMPPQMPATEKKPIGPIIGVIVILILLILGGLYFFWSSKLDGVEDTLPYIPSDISQNLPPTSSSDAITDIDADVAATDLDALEAQIDADLKTAESSL